MANLSNINENQFRFNRIQPEHFADRLNAVNFVFTDAGLQVLRGQLFKYNINPPNEREELDVPDGVSMFGTPIFNRLTLGAEKKVGGGFIVAINDEQENYKIVDLDSCLITVNLTKNIISTSLPGRDGTVKEYISKGDYSISVEGVISSKEYSQNYPQEEVEDFIKIMEIAQEIDVTSTFLAHFGITKLVITDYVIPQQRGIRNVQAFSFQALSDEDVYNQQGF